MAVVTQVPLQIDKAIRAAALSRHTPLIRYRHGCVGRPVRLLPAQARIKSNVRPWACSIAVYSLGHTPQPELTVKFDRGPSLRLVHPDSDNEHCTSLVNSQGGHYVCMDRPDSLSVTTDNVEPASLSETANPFEIVCSLLQPLSPQTIEWFAKRKITAATLQHNKVHEGLLKDTQNTTTSAIAFVYPSHDGSTEIKLRTLDKQWKHYFAVKGQGTLYGLANLQHSPTTIIIVEGEIDKLSLDEAGIQNAVSVPDGAPERVRDKALPPPAADKAFSYLWQSHEYLQQASRILLASDNDPPGHALAEELARRLGRDRCLRVLWQPPKQHASAAGPCKDANDVLVQYGVHAVQQCIADAKPLPTNGAFECYPEKQKRHRRNQASTTAGQAM